MFVNPDPFFRDTDFMLEPGNATSSNGCGNVSSSKQFATAIPSPTGSPYLHSEAPTMTKDFVIRQQPSRDDRNHNVPNSTQFFVESVGRVHLPVLDPERFLKLALLITGGNPSKLFALICDACNEHRRTGRSVRIGTVQGIRLEKRVFSLSSVLGEAPSGRPDPRDCVLAADSTCDCAFDQANK
jgi:hypothetical protein